MQLSIEMAERPHALLTVILAIILVKQSGLKVKIRSPLERQAPLADVAFVLRRIEFDFHRLYCSYKKIDPQRQKRCARDLGDGIYGVVEAKCKSDVQLKGADGLISTATKSKSQMQVRCFDSPAAR